MHHAGFCKMEYNGHVDHHTMSFKAWIDGGLVVSSTLSLGLCYTEVHKVESLFQCSLQTYCMLLEGIPYDVPYMGPSDNFRHDSIRVNT